MYENTLDTGALMNTLFVFDCNATELFLHNTIRV
jgi:hypothetical protein